MAGEKTEPATGKRREDERKKGNVFQSHEIVVVASLLIIFYSIKLLWPTIYTAIVRSFELCFAQEASLTSVSASDVNGIYIPYMINVVVAIMPILLICVLISVVVTLAQTKLLVSFQSMKPKFSRMSPLNGIKKVFSSRGFVELVKSIIKITVLSYVVYLVLKVEIPLMPRLLDMSMSQSLAQIGKIIMDIVNRAAIAFAFLAGFDYLYQRWEYEKNIKMSKQEVKEEYKQLEGDPQIKGKIKERQQQQARRRMMQAVPSADVVIRNPTHFAVAIKYEPKNNRAPVVVAKGMDSLALKIVKVAEEHGVAITENKPLARSLYEAVDLDREIPDKFYQAVAEVLAFVYNIKKKDLS